MRKARDSRTRRSATQRGVAAVFAAILASCAINPVTQERELSFMSVEEEKAAGAEEAKRIEEQIGLVRDEALNAYVRSVGTRLAVHSPRKEVDYTFYVVDSDAVNAFVTPGAYIYVTRGLLALANSEEELAGVLGHEVGHAAALHVSTANWRGGVAQVMTGVGALVGTVVGGPFGAIGLGKLAQNSGRKMVSANSREKEELADQIGQELMLKAGWDPARFGDFFRASDRSATQKRKAVKVASAYDTHPVSVERMAAAKARGEALGKPAAGTPPALERPAFLGKMRGVVIGEDVRDGVFDKQDPTLFLQPELGFRARFPEGWNAVHAPTFVYASDGLVAVLLEPQGEGSDLKRASQEYFKQVDRELREERAKKKSKRSKDKDEDKDGKDDDGKEQEIDDDEIQEKDDLEPLYDIRKAGVRRVGKNRTAYVVEGTAEKGQITVLQHWIAVPPNVLRVTCVMVTQTLQAYLDDCRRTAGSVAPIRRKDRERAKQVTVDVIEAQPGETLEAFNERTQNQWSIEQTAAANALSLPYVLAQGQLVKYARAAVYEPAGRATPDAPEEPEETDESASGPETSGK